MRWIAGQAVAQSDDRARSVPAREPYNGRVIVDSGRGESRVERRPEIGERFRRTPRVVMNQCATDERGGKPGVKHQRAVEIGTRPVESA